MTAFSRMTATDNHGRRDASEIDRILCANGEPTLNNIVESPTDKPESELHAWRIANWGSLDDIENYSYDKDAELIKFTSRLGSPDRVISEISSMIPNLTIENIVGFGTDSAIISRENWRAGQRIQAISEFTTYLHDYLAVGKPMTRSIKTILLEIDVENNGYIGAQQSALMDRLAPKGCHAVDHQGLVYYLGLTLDNLEKMVNHRVISPTDPFYTIAKTVDPEKRSGLYFDGGFIPEYGLFAIDRSYYRDDCGYDPELLAAPAEILSDAMDEIHEHVPDHLYLDKEHHIDAKGDIHLKGVCSHPQAVLAYAKATGAGDPFISHRVEAAESDLSTVTWI